jgi:hypothetical protein
MPSQIYWASEDDMIKPDPMKSCEARNIRGMPIEMNVAAFQMISSQSVGKRKFHADKCTAPTAAYKFIDSR